MRIALLVPYYNEELTIAKVIKDFKKELPDSKIYVDDNNSKDKHLKLPREMGHMLKKRDLNVREMSFGQCLGI